MNMPLDVPSGYCLSEKHSLVPRIAHGHHFLPQARAIIGVVAFPRAVSPESRLSIIRDCLPDLGEDLVYWEALAPNSGSTVYAIGGYEAKKAGAVYAAFAEGSPRKSAEAARRWYAWKYKGRAGRRSLIWHILRDPFDPSGRNYVLLDILTTG